MYCYFQFSVQHQNREGSALMSRAIWELQFRLCFKGSHKIKSLFISIKRKKNFITSWIFQHACWGNLRSVLQKENKSTDILWSNVIIRQKSYIEKMIYSIQSTTIEHVLLFLSSESTRIFFFDNNEGLSPKKKNYTEINLGVMECFLFKKI
jgi:hypothetical protein